MEPKWLEWGRALQMIAQNGLAYCKNAFDIERFEQVRHISAEILAGHTDAGTDRLEKLFADQEGYATPKIDVRGAVIHGEKILLVSETMDGGRWTLPGGWADMTDAPSQAVEREIREEAGYTTRAVKLAAVYDRSKHGHPPYYFNTYKLFFLCKILPGSLDALIPNLETGGADFFPEDGLPELSISRVTEEEIHMLFRHARNPDIPTEFD